ncbi:MAG: hypothetical protein ACPGNP_12330, partial [Acidimicrobiales bacterium]
GSARRGRSRSSRRRPRGRSGRAGSAAGRRSTGRSSDQPACQFYTGAFLPDTEGGGRTHGAFAALALEPQHVADAPNLPWAPSPVVRPGDPYRHHLEFRLTTDASEAS